MKKMVVAYVDSARRGSCIAASDAPAPSVLDFEAEARKMMVASGVLTTEEGARATFKVQD